MSVGGRTVRFMTTRRLRRRRWLMRALPFCVALVPSSAAAPHVWHGATQVSVVQSTGLRYQPMQGGLVMFNDTTRPISVTATATATAPIIEVDDCLKFTLTGTRTAQVNYIVPAGDWSSTAVRLSSPGSVTLRLPDAVFTFDGVVRSR